MNRKIAQNNIQSKLCMKDNSLRVYCLRFKGVEPLCPPSHITWFTPEQCGGVVEGKVKIQIVWLSNCSVNARPIWGISCSFNVFVFDGFLSVNINNYFMVGLLFKTALCKMTSARTVFINFQLNRQIIKELFKSDLMKFWKISDGFLIYCVNFVNRRKGLKQFKEVNKLLFRLVPALEI